MEASPESAIGFPFSAESPSRWTTEEAEEIGVGGMREGSGSGLLGDSSCASSGGGVVTPVWSLSTMTIEPSELVEARLEVLRVLLRDLFAVSDSIGGAAAAWDFLKGELVEGPLPTWPK
jgi:hypothetical protein